MKGRIITIHRVQCGSPGCTNKVDSAPGISAARFGVQLQRDGWTQPANTKLWVCPEDKNLEAQRAARS